MINDKGTSSRSMLLEVVPEEVEVEQVDDITKCSNAGLMGPPLFPPKRIDSRSDDKSSPSSSSIGSSDESSDSFDFQPPLPNGQYSFISARYTAQIRRNNSTAGLNAAIISSEIRSGSFIKSSLPPTVNTNLLTKKPSKALTKGIQLMPIGVYNNNVGSSKMREIQMPDFKQFQTIKTTPKPARINAIQNQSSDAQDKRHRALKHWWDNKINSQRRNEIGQPSCSKGGCSVSPERLDEDPQTSTDDGIREGLVPYVPNQFFLPPQQITPEPKRFSEKEQEQIRSRLLWEAVQDGLISLEMILALPIDWGDICLAHYQKSGLISTTTNSSLTSTYLLQNPLTIKASQLQITKGTSLLSDKKSKQILLQYTK